MSNLLEIRVCDYCQKEFEVEKKSRKKYCGNTCRVYASQERNGKREKRVPETPKVIPSDLSQQIEQQSQVVKQLRQKYEDAKKELQVICDGGVYQEIRMLENRLKRLQSSEEINTNDSIKIQQLQLIIEQLEQKKQLEKDRENLLPVLISQCWMDLFKAQKELNKLKMVSIQQKNDGYMTGNTIDEILEATTYYEFDYLVNDYDFDFTWHNEHDVVTWSLVPLGKLKVPFSAMLYGESFYSIVSVSMWLAANLRNRHDAKILYILDEGQNQIDFLTRLRDIEHFKKHDNFKIKVVKSRGELEISLQSFIPDFLFINDARALRIDGNFIRQTQLKYDDTSIFCLSENEIHSIGQSADLIYELSEEHERFRKGGSKHYREFFDWMYD